MRRSVLQATVVVVGIASAFTLGSRVPAGEAGDPLPDRHGAASSNAVSPLEGYELVDLTRPFGARTVYWPTAPSGFRFDTISHGRAEGGYFYSAFRFAAPEHGGTHMDAPLHFAAGRHAAHEVPLERLIAPAVVIDVSEVAAVDPDYRLGADAVGAFEAEHGRIPPGAVVLLRTGWDVRWPDPTRYLGPSAPEGADDLHFPSFGPGAVRLLVEERSVAALGADVASIDPGDSEDFPVHRIALGANVPGYENLTNLGTLPPTGAWIFALPMKIEGGSGAPLRAVALVPEGERSGG